MNERAEITSTALFGMCGRCYDEDVQLFSANCAETPEALAGVPLGQYHCPDCGAMVIAGLPHPPMCRACIERRHPRRIQRRRTKGWRMPENTVSVCRPGKWGNPFPVEGNDAHGRRVAVWNYKLWIQGTDEGRRIAEAAKRELRGKNLACWCPQDQACHADVLLRIANKEMSNEE